MQGQLPSTPYAGVAATNTRQDLDTGREEKRNQQRDRNFNPKKKVIIIGDSMLKQIKDKISTIICTTPSHTSKHSQVLPAKT